VFLLEGVQVRIQLGLLIFMSLDSTPHPQELENQNFCVFEKQAPWVIFINIDIQ
jgi:hypothetical protein